MPKFDPIMYLVGKRFPLVAKQSSPSPFADPEVREHYQDQAQKAKVYRAELKSKSPEEVEALVTQERIKEAACEAKRLQDEENGRFFHQPYAKANFEHWGKLSYWTLDEAVALSFGRAPEFVNWKSIEVYVKYSSFAFGYGRRRELSNRAKVMKELYDPVLPGFFIAWAKRLKWDIPEGLEKVVVERGGDIADWKTYYEREKAKNEEMLKWAEAKQQELLEFAKDSQAKAFEIGKQAVAQRDKIIAKLREDLAETERRAAENAGRIESGPKEASPRQRNSMLKLIIGMAIGGYGMDPQAARSPVTKQIADDLLRGGIGLDEDTIRKYLQLGKEVLGDLKTEGGD